MMKTLLLIIFILNLSMSYGERWVEIDDSQRRIIGKNKRLIKGRDILIPESSNEGIKEQISEIEPEFSWPITWKGATSQWGYRTDPLTGAKQIKHSGIDLRAKMDTPVYAPADGKIRVAEWQSGYGRLVIIDHGFGYSTRFGHLNKYLIRTGDVVKKGELIAYTGNSGRSTGPHLHYEIRKNEVALDPLKFRGQDILAQTPHKNIDEVVSSKEYLDNIKR